MTSERNRLVFANKQLIFVCLALAVLLRGSATFADETKQRLLNLPTPPFNYSKLELPKHFAKTAKRFDNTPDENPITDRGATLGRVLFYDRGLSANGKTSCASCHQQDFAFTDPEKLSIGFAGERVDRNSMSLINVRYYKRGRMFWDERASTLEEQVLMPIENPIEMGHDLNRLLTQLTDDPLYPPLFADAFGDSTVTRIRVAKALSQFVRSIVSYRSAYDRGRSAVKLATDPFPNFTQQQNEGKAVFFGRARCAECHLENSQASQASQASPGNPQSAFFYLATPASNGVDSDEPNDDRGVGNQTKRAQDNGKFKVSSLRNIELTGPYMHDGRFHTLDQVIEHYNWSVRPHPNLDKRLADFAANGLALPETQKVALAEFLKTLTDHELIKDERYGDPFVR